MRIHQLGIKVRILSPPLNLNKITRLGILLIVKNYNMVTIKLNEPQPLDCPECKSKEGYQYSDLYRMSYTSQHNSYGEYEGGQYNDGVNLNRGVSTFCCNCGARLPFKLDRSGIQNVDIVIPVN
jgi:hypothetical protein